MIVDHGRRAADLVERLRIMIVMRITKINDLGYRVLSRVGARAGGFHDP